MAAQILGIVFLLAFKINNLIMAFTIFVILFAQASLVCLNFAKLDLLSKEEIQPKFNSHLWLRPIYFQIKYDI